MALGVAHAVIRTAEPVVTVTHDRRRTVGPEATATTAAVRAVTRARVTRAIGATTVVAIRTGRSPADVRVMTNAAIVVTIVAMTVVDRSVMIVGRAGIGISRVSRTGSRRSVGISRVSR
ncbi:hypothetical protein, partial [Parasphingorhabdus pacifica]